MGLGAVDLWGCETHKNTEFGFGPWTAAGCKAKKQNMCE